MHSVRSHLGCEDDAFGCMGNGEDAEGVKGVFLRRNVVNVAGRALKYNLTCLGPLVLPYSQLVCPKLSHKSLITQHRFILPCCKLELFG
jgi:3-ketoacyl-CoA synthase